MAEALSHKRQLALDQALAQWRQWRCDPPLVMKPTLTRPLSDGLSNDSFLVESQSSRYVIRLDGVNPTVAGLNRQAEWKALHTASEAGLAPCPRYHNPELGVLVCDYIDADDHADEDPSATAQLLRAIHQLPGLHFRLDLNERIKRYEKHVEHRDGNSQSVLHSFRPTIVTLISALEANHHERVLCHNDLLRANRIDSAGRLKAIDWEYCAMGSRWFDLAVVRVGDDMETTAAETLLTTYLGRSASNEERRTLGQFEAVYRYLELLWFAALDNPEQREKHFTEERLQQLDKALGVIS